MAFTTTGSGLQFEDTIVGDGAAAAPGSNITVQSTGWICEDGERGARFGSSRDGAGPLSLSCGVGMVIKGWDQRVQGMRVGGRRTLILPASLRYGARGAGGVRPPRASLKK